MKVGKVVNGVGPYWTKSGKKRFKVHYQDPSGRQRTKGGFWTKTDARHWQAHNTTAIDKGEYVDLSKKKERFGPFAETWYLKKEKKVRPNTADGYRRLLDNHILPTFDNMSFGRITRGTVEDWIEDLEKPSVKARSYRLLNAILKDAVRKGYSAFNPADIENPPTEGSYTPGATTVDVARTLATAVPAHRKALVLVAALCGLRWGEAIALDLEHIDLQAQTLEVNQQVIETRGLPLHLGPPKTEAGVRTVLMPLEVVRAIKDHLKEHGTNKQGLLFFCEPRNGNNPNGYLRRSNFRRHWRKANDTVGVDVHFHDLRHVAGTLAASTGAPTKEIQAYLGHSTPGASLRYQHSTQAGQKTLQREMNERLGTQLSAVEETG